MDRLGRYPLSVILSFLTETEGCSLLITRRKWTLQLLPIFRLPNQSSSTRHHHYHHPFGLLSVVGGAPQPPPQFQNRHRFVVVPVQDATIRLDRLNTRRWKQRRLRHRHKTTSQVAQEEWRQPQPYPPLLRFWPSVGGSAIGGDNGEQNAVFRKGITLLVSYPRSGNTLLRSLLESVTGIVTASDTRPDRTLSQALAKQHDLVGEGLCRPPICKTHWPERIGCQRFPASRAILVVRNPWDAMDSYWNLNLTNTHTEKVIEEVYEQHQTFFQELVCNEMRVWLEFTKFWYAASIPLLVVRYEDLVRHPRLELERILNFYTTTDWTDRLDTVFSSPNNSGHGYQSSSSSSSPSIGRSIPGGRYTPALLRTLHEMDDSGDGWLRKFGYHVFQQQFPHNLDSLPPLSPARTTNQRPNKVLGGTTMVINQPEIDLRPRTCPYGRNMRDWRRQRTMDDTQPFPTVPKKKK